MLYNMRDASFNWSIKKTFLKEGLKKNSSLLYTHAVVETALSFHDAEYDQMSLIILLY